MGLTTPTPPLASPFGLTVLTSLMMLLAGPVRDPPPCSYGGRGDEDNNRHTALQWAVFHGSLAVACYLLDHGADVNAPSADEATTSDFYMLRALDIGAFYGRMDIVQLLIDAGGRSGYCPKRCTTILITIRAIRKMSILIPSVLSGEARRPSLYFYVQN